METDPDKLFEELAEHESIREVFTEIVTVTEGSGAKNNWAVGHHTIGEEIME